MLVLPSVVFAQAAIQVRPTGEGGVSVPCLEPEALTRRLSHYGRVELLGELRLQAEIAMDSDEGGELRLVRGDRVLSRRRLSGLPRSCQDRTDAVALVLAMALEHIATEHVESGDPARPNDRGLRAEARRATTKERDVEARATTSTAARGEGADAASGRTERASQSASAQTDDPWLLVGREPSPAPSDAVGTDASIPPGGAGDPASAAPSDEGRVSLGGPGAGETRARGPLFEDFYAGGRYVGEALPWGVWLGAAGLDLAVAGPVSISVGGFGSAVGETAFGGGRLRGALFGGEVLACAGNSGHALTVSACLGSALAMGHVSARGYYENLPADRVAWSAALARAGLRWPSRDRLSLRLFAQLQVNLVKPELRVAGHSRSAAAASVGGTLGVDLVVGLN